MCRVRSDFYVPSESWVEGAEKEQLIVTAKQKCRCVCVCALQLLEQHYSPELVSILILILVLAYRYEYCSFFAKSGRCPFEEDCQFAAARTREARLEVRRVHDVFEALSTDAGDAVSAARHFISFSTVSKRSLPG